MQFLRRYCVTTLASLLCANFISFQSSAADTVNTNHSITNVDGKITIDGNLNESIWQQATVIDLDIVNSPWNNKPSPVKTTAKILENGDTLYIAFIAQDPDPSKIKAYLGDRDSRRSDDFVGIKLDTYNNRRLNYEFFVNPYGVQMDGIKNVMTGTSNNSWDGMWDAFGKITEEGYQVEIAIPYSILNFDNNNDTKQWAFELIRFYPRDLSMRISHQILDRDNDCWLCQSPTMTGFKEAKASKNLMITPSLVANRNDTRDIYDSTDNWHTDDDIDAGIDIRWGINSNTLLNATINPDFSTVETDSGQLSINKTYSLFYEEKRPFFLDNADYFTSDFNLVYTRNIADPDYGAKLTSTENQHSYGVFITNDTETNFVVPGNTGSDIAALNEESHSAAFKYRYDFTADFSIGAISTLRTANDYHNYVSGVDSKYRYDESNTFSGQVLNSNTEYPEDLYQDFCYGESNTDCDTTEGLLCSFGQCAFSEQSHRTNKQGDFSDQAIKLTFEHDSEYWGLTAEHQTIGEDFRADLGFMTKADYQSERVLLDRYFYGDVDSPWQEIKLSGQWLIEHNENGELLNKSLASSFSIDGPMQSYFDVLLNYDDKIGLRHDESSLAIDGNTSRFTEKTATLYANIEPNNRYFVEAEVIIGDKIDYQNNRLGDYLSLYAGLTYNFSKHLTADVYFTHAEMDADGSNVYTAELTELRLAYQFDVYSYLKLNVVYSDVDQNIDNNPHAFVSNKNKNLSTQLIYAYKLNPQTVFYLGYSDNSYQDDYLNDLEREQRTFFTKISYAWMP